MKDTVKAYIDHLRVPGVAFTNIREFNSKNRSDIEENRSLEEAIKKARKEMGPNDFLVQNFNHYLKQTSSVESKPEKEASLDDLLAEDMEDEYNEVCDDCKKTHTNEVCDAKSQLLEKANIITDENALKHLVGFYAGGEVKLMKGKSRYIEQLKAYVGGDSMAEVRMLDRSKMFISELEPNTESLKELFSTFPSGPHLVVCD
jgi:midasin (ATPase involved in ribosome maturation)